MGQTLYKEDKMYKYTLCLIKKGNDLLLLNRSKSPAMGMWNGIGGKTEENETPAEGVIREVYEESGIELVDPVYVGNAVLKSEVRFDGIYLFIAEITEDLQVQTPLMIDEGILDWKSINWILDEDNMGVISNLKCYLPKILEGQYGLEHTFLYDIHNIKDYTMSVITEKEVYKKKIYRNISN